MGAISAWLRMAIRLLLDDFAGWEVVEIKPGDAVLIRTGFMKHWSDKIIKSGGVLRWSATQDGEPGGPFRGLCGRWGLWVLICLGTSELVELYRRFDVSCCHQVTRSSPWTVSAIWEGVSLRRLNPFFVVLPAGSWTISSFVKAWDTRWYDLERSITSNSSITNPPGVLLNLRNNPRFQGSWGHSYSELPGLQWPLWRPVRRFWYWVCRGYPVGQIISVQRGKREAFAFVSSVM